MYSEVTVVLFPYWTWCVICLLNVVRISRSVAISLCHSAEFLCKCLPWVQMSFLIASSPLTLLIWFLVVPLKCTFESRLRRAPAGTNHGVGLQATLWVKCTDSSHVCVCYCSRLLWFHFCQLRSQERCFSLSAYLWKQNKAPQTTSQSLKLWIHWCSWYLAALINVHDLAF